MTVPAAAQWFIENRGQWERQVQYVSTGGDVVITATELRWQHAGTWERLSLADVTIEPAEQAAAQVNVYVPGGAFEGLRLWRQMRWRGRDGSTRAIAAWTRRGLELTLSDGSSPRLLAERTAEPLDSWARGGRFIGASGRDSVTAMHTLGGAIYLAGWTSSSSFYGTSGAGGGDGFCIKLSSTGELQWATLIGGSGEDVALALAATSERIALVGRTRSTNFPTTAGTVQPNYGGGDADGFVVTLDPTSGSRSAATYIGGDGHDELRTVTVGSDGRIAAAGTTASAQLPATAHQQQFGGLEDGYVVVLAPTLASRIWSSYYGGRGFDSIAGVGFLPDGSLVIAGTTTSPNTGEAIAANIGEGSLRMTPPDGFLARLGTSGQRLWGRYYGSDGQDSITSLSISESGMILVTGFTNGTNTAMSYFAEAQAAQNNFAGGPWDGFVAVIRPDGTRLWGSYYGGTGSDRCTGALMDAQGYVYVTGWTTSSDLPREASENTTIAGAEDVMLGFFSPDGRRRYASLLYGGSGSDLPSGIGWLADSTIAIAGSTSSGSFPPLDGQGSGDFDGFVLRVGGLGILSAEEPPAPNTPFRIAGSRLHVSLPEECRPARLEIYTLCGMLYTSCQEITTTVEFELPAGAYAVRLHCVQGAEFRAVVVVP
ncbi:MAG: hypothetical protein KatS3mg038_1704 [Candidatus Kapaibacterium sp.]|nr:MAG: hypothetical protein KatS3mg038_1704 [Candidatus Kapabacteria bacterium]